MIVRTATSPPQPEEGAQAHRLGRWRPANWRIRTKMAVVLLVPTLTALIFGGLRIRAEITEATDLGSVFTQVDTAGALTAVVHELQHERNLVTAGSPAAGQYRATDAAIGRLRTSLGNLHTPDAASHARYDYAVRGLDKLAGLRANSADKQAGFAGYTSIIGGLNQLSYEISGANGLSRTGAAVEAIGRAKEHAAQADALVLLAAVHGRFGSAGEQNHARYQNSGFASSIEDFKAVSTSDERNYYIVRLRGNLIDDHQRLLTSLLRASDPRARITADPADLADAAQADNQRLRDAEKRLIGDLRNQTAQRAATAGHAAIRDSVIIVVAVLLAVLLMLRVASWLITPLRRLHRGAHEVAHTTLPETVRRLLTDPACARQAPQISPVPVHSTDEVGEVARSIDAVQRTAIGMAAEQALLRENINSIFVNLSRRSQALIERQLTELDRLEQEETDPARRGQLFQLDHLVGRLRRNSENLLVLSGAGLVRRSSSPMALIDVLQAAVAEIEDYPRVRLTGIPEVYLQGRVINDVVHLLAELLDNAVTFSPPTTTVTVTAAVTGAGPLAVHITDEGMGLTDDEQETLNASLATPPEFDVSLSRRMGLYVVARLAQRHDLRVRLRPAEPAGTTAVITAPATLLAEAPPQAPEPQEPEPPAFEPQAVTQPVEPTEPAGTEPLTAEPATAAGLLPKRVPRAQLARPEAEPATGPLAAAEFDALPGTLRSAEALRDRLSGLQRGLARARAISGNDEDDGAHP